MKQRMCLALLLSGFVAAACSTAMAEDFQPTEPIEFVVHTGAGGGGDLMARAVAQILEQEHLLDKRILVTNKPGGNGAVAMAYLAEKEGNGSTLGIFTSTWLINSIVSKDTKIRMGDLTPVVGLVNEPAFFMVKADSPIKTLKDFIDAAKANPGKMKQAGGGLASSIFVTHLLLKTSTGADWGYVSFPSGGERVAALLGGHVDIVLMEPQEAGEHLRAGTMRALAVVSDQRLAAYPDVPTLKEAGFDVPIIPQVRGVVAPPGMPAEALKYWEDLFAKMVQTESWKKYLEENQIQDGFTKSADLKAFVDGYIGNVTGMFKAAGIETAQ